MGVTEIDHNAVKLRIQAILQADATLYNSTNKKGGLVLSVNLGLPDGNDWAFWPYPYLTVTNDTNWEADKPFGAITGTNPTSNISTSHHTVKYMIIGMTSKPTAAMTEASLDAIHKETKTALKNNVKLTNPSDGTSNLNVIQSVCRTSRYVDGGKYNGQSVNGFIITLEVIIVS